MKISKVYAYSAFVLIFLAFATLSSYAYSPSPYTMKDLEILQEEKAYIEFFDHALDLKPVERNSRWREMVYNTSENFLKEIIETQRFSNQIYNYIEKLTLWPTLRNNEIFQVRRGKYGLIFFKNCLDTEKKAATLTNSRCFFKIETFWRNTPKDFINLKLGLELAKLTKTFLPQEDLWFFYSSITLHKYAGEMCNNNEIPNAFIYKIFKDKSFSTNLNLLKTLIGQYSSDSCFNNMVDSIKAKLITENDTQLLTKYLSLLFAKNALSQEESDYYLVQYILNNPETGPLFNLAWNTIQELGKDYKRRLQVINHLKVQTLLPGRLFQIRNKKRLKIIFSFFNKNIPEYLDLYSKTCLRYLKGQLPTDSGNPTPSCHDLFRNSLSSLWLSPQMKQAYKESL